MKKNKTTANQSPWPELYEESPTPKERLRVSNWIAQDSRLIAKEIPSVPPLNDSPLGSLLSMKFRRGGNLPTVAGDVNDELRNWQAGINYAKRKRLAARLAITPSSCARCALANSRLPHSTRARCAEQRVAPQKQFSSSDLCRWSSRPRIMHQT